MYFVWSVGRQTKNSWKLVRGQFEKALFRQKSQPCAIIFFVKSQDVTSTRFSLTSFLYQRWAWKSDFLTKISLLWTVTKLLTTYSRVQTDINIFLSQLLKPDLLKKVLFFSRTQFICLINCITKKVGNRKMKPTFIISVLKVEYWVGLVFFKFRLFY